MEGVEKVATRRSSRPNFADDVYGSPSPAPSAEPIESSLAQRRAATAILTKLKELKDSNAQLNSSTAQTRQPADLLSEMNDCPELDYEYKDSDSFAMELAELYAYSEMPDFAANAFCYRNFAEERKICAPFSSLSRSEQKGLIEDLFSRIESVNADSRLQSARTLLYILQGAYLDYAEDGDEAEGGEDKDRLSSPIDRGTGSHEEECLLGSVAHAYLAYECGAFSALVGLLMAELGIAFDVRDEAVSTCGRDSKASSISNSRSASNVDLAENERRCRRSATLSDNECLRVVLSCLCHLVECIRRPELIEKIASSHDRRTALASSRASFLAELEEPVERVGQPLLMVLFDMCPPFYNGEAPHYPMRKVLLLIWKILLALMGGWKQLAESKAVMRAAAGLSSIEDTLEVASTMRPCTVRESEGAVRGGAMGGAGPTGRRAQSRLVMSRQLACTSDETGQGEMEELESEGENSGSTTPILEEEEGTRPSEEERERDEESGERTPTAGSPGPLRKKQLQLPWKTKARLEDIDTFLQNARQKFLNYELRGDVDTLFALPPSIHGSAATLKKHLYTSLADLQMRKESQLNRYTFSMKEKVEMSIQEKVYRWMLPSLSQYVVALLKVLLAAAPSSKAKNDALNILCDVLTRETECSDVLSNSISLEHPSGCPLEHSLTLTIDINRHKEVLVKATSAILILLLKHFRLSHIYEFEFLAQHIHLGNGVPLLLKLLDQNMNRYVQSRHELHAYNFPQVCLHWARNSEEWPVLSAENVESTVASESGGAYCMGRNVFSSINLVRVLNKITKWKHSRTMLLVVFKSAPILKRCLKIKLAVFQVYVLKLLKMQSRFLGRQWRRCNMDVISSIYCKVRHRLSDDWAFGNDTRTKSWDFRNVEAELKAAVERFNARRYAKFFPAFALTEGECCPSSPEGAGPSGWADEDWLGRAEGPEWQPTEKNANAVLGVRVELGEKFKKNYEKWMEAEVIRSRIDWDLLIENTRGVAASPSF